MTARRLRLIHKARARKFRKNFATGGRWEYGTWPQWRDPDLTPPGKTGCPVTDRLVEYGPGILHIDLTPWERTPIDPRTLTDREHATAQMIAAYNERRTIETTPTEDGR